MLCSIVWCLVILNTTVYSGFTAIHFREKHFMAVIAWTLMIRPQGVDNGAFVVLPETVWYARVLLLFSAAAATDTGSKSFECALVSTLETYDDPENGNYINYITYICYVYYNTLYKLKHFRLAEICRFPCPIRARLH